MKTRPSFLYIEDHSASRRVLQMLLLDIMGYQHLTLLEDTRQLFEKLDELNQDFDVIFLDLDLEPEDGYETCKKLRTHHRYHCARIFALTATNHPAEIRKMQAAGFDGLLNKPLGMDSFPEQVHRILSGESLWEIAE